MREGDLDRVPFQCGVQFPQVVCHDSGGLLHRSGCKPDHELKVQAAVPKPDKPDLWLMFVHIRERVRNRGCRLESGRSHPFLVRAIGHAKRNVDTTIFLV